MGPQNAPKSISHETGSLEELFRAHQRGLLGAVRGVLGPRADAREVVQDAFLTAWEKQQGGFRADDPRAWIFVLTLNRARDVARKRARRGVPLDLSKVDEAVTTARHTEPDAQLMRDESLSAAKGAIVRLRENEKEVFLLRVSGGLTFEAIGRALEIPVGTAKSRMRAALASLRRDLAPFAPRHLDRTGDAL